MALGLLMYAVVAVVIIVMGIMEPMTDTVFLGLLFGAAGATLVAVAAGPTIRDAFVRRADQSGATPEEALRTAAIITMALCEGPALLGITAALLLGSWAWVVAVAGAGMLAALRVLAA